MRALAVSSAVNLAAITGTYFAFGSTNPNPNLHARVSPDRLPILGAAVKGGYASAKAVLVCGSSAVLVLRKF